MRAVAILMLFAAAVVLPNEIGTDALPAIGGKAAAKTHGKAKATASPARTLACARAVEFHVSGGPGFGEPPRSLQTAGRAQRSQPLLM